MLGHNVRRLREQADLTQAELAGRLGTSQSYLSGIETGGKQPSYAMLMRLAAALGVSLDTLVRGEGEADAAAQRA